MKKLSLLSATLALALLPMTATVVHAQAPSRVPRGGMENHEEQERKQKAAQAKVQAAETAEVAKFPLATRVAPKQMGSPKLAKEMHELFELKDKNTNPDELIAKADAIIADPRAMPFDVSAANYIAGYAWLAKDTTDYKNAIKYTAAAVTANGMSNNTHYQLMLQVAQMLESDENHAEALTWLNRFLDETKSDDANAITLKARIMLATDKPQAAAEPLEKLLAKKPNDKALMWNLVSVYTQADQDAKAGQMVDKMRSAGLLTESKDYDQAFRLYANIDGRENDALAVIDEGLKKGILKPGYDIYSFQGHSYYDAGQIPQAIEAWNKAAPLAKDGEMYLNVAKLQADQSHWAEAKAAAQSAMEKGVKRKGEAWQVVARSETALHNKAAAKAAMLETAKYPETKKWAEAALRQTSAK
jgi:tetratricopeptide (TPR) repeat protein